MPTAEPYSAIVDRTVPGLQQGKDAIIPFTLSLPNGSADQSLIALASTDQIFMQVKQREVDSNGKPKLTDRFKIDGAKVTIIPSEHRFIFRIARADTLTLKASPNESVIRLYGTVFILEQNGASRPSSKFDLYLPLEPAFL